MTKKAKKSREIWGEGEILHLDVARPILEIDTWGGVVYHVPLLTNDGEETKTVVSAEAAHRLAKRFKMKMQMG